MKKIISSIVFSLLLSVSFLQADIIFDNKELELGGGNTIHATLKYEYGSYVLEIHPGHNVYIGGTATGNKRTEHTMDWTVSVVGKGRWSMLDASIEDVINEMLRRGLS